MPNMSGDAKAQFEAKIAEEEDLLKQKGRKPNRQKATVAAAEKYPELHRAYVQSANRQAIPRHIGERAG